MGRSYIWRHDPDPCDLHFPRLRWRVVGRVSLVFSSGRVGGRRLLRGQKKRAMAPCGVWHGRRLTLGGDVLEHPGVGARPRMDVHANGAWLLHWLPDCCYRSSALVLQDGADQHLQLFGHALWHGGPQNGVGVFLAEPGGRRVVQAVSRGPGPRGPRAGTVGRRRGPGLVVCRHHRRHPGGHIRLHPPERHGHCDLDGHPSDGLHAAGGGHDRRRHLARWWTRLAGLAFCPV